MNSNEAYLKALEDVSHALVVLVNQKHAVMKQRDGEGPTAWLASGVWLGVMEALNRVNDMKAATREAGVA